MATFNYSLMPVDSLKHEIRVLEILPYTQDLKSTPHIIIHGEQADESSHPRVRCNMKRVSLDDAPTYTALSYAWGDSRDRRLIVVDDTEVSVGANLESALYNLRHAAATITLWCDALCINQTDDPEKSELVSQMNRVYQDAKLVIVWLGPGSEDSAIALDAMDRIGKEACDVGFWDVPRHEWLQAWSNANGLYARLHDLMEDWMSLDLPFEAVAKITRRSWWYRVWVLQEFVLAKDVSFTCGFSRIDSQYFTAAIIFFAVAVIKLANRVELADWEDPINGPKVRSVFMTTMNSKSAVMLGARRSFQDDAGSRDSLIQLLRRANCVSAALNNLQATDPRDRIFGMLALASDTDQLGIYPDYSKSCRAVYTDAARKLLQHGHTDVLGFTQFPKLCEGLPTWVPDWTTTIHEPCGGCVADACFSASGKIPLCSVPIASSELEGLIALDGVRVDTIIQVRTPWLPTIDLETHDWEQWKIFISDIEFLCNQSDQLDRPIYQSPEQREEAVWRIPCGDMDRLGMGGSRARITGSETFEGFKLLKAGFEPNGARTGHLPQLHSYTTSMRDMLKRRPFLSSQGYVGLAPSHAEVGDLIVIIYGAVVPFIIRDVGNGRFELVGEAYVHGIMDGEYVENSPPTETFILS